MDYVERESNTSDKIQLIHPKNENRWRKFFFV